MREFKIGDLVQHIKDKRLAIVLSDTRPLHGAYVCSVVWSDSYTHNLMDTRLLVRIGA